MIPVLLAAVALATPPYSGPWEPYTVDQQTCSHMLYFAQNTWDGSSAWTDGKFHFPPECGISPVAPHPSRRARIF